MIAYADFARLRLADFFPELEVVPAGARDPGAGRRFSGKEIIQVKNWAFDDRVHVGELLGFTEVLRTKKEPERTRSIAIELERLPAGKSQAMLKALGLDLERGMTERALTQRFGKPVRRYSFVADREQLEYKTRAPVYRITCTILKRGGLSYVVVTRMR
jgi:hypothetical protein